MWGIEVEDSMGAEDKGDVADTSAVWHGLGVDDPRIVLAVGIVPIHLS